MSYKLGITYILLSILFLQVNANNYQSGANSTFEYIPILKGKKIGVVVNQTSTIGSIHLVDSLLKLGINIQIIFAPEHGYRGTADAGEHIENEKDPKTGISLISLYGANHKPNAAQLKGIDIVLFDIQDVGVRFYTYLSTLHYVMEACAENKIQLIVLDRPNPNGFYVDGPVMEKKYMSFVGLHPVPIVYGMTIGEYALMINGELWLKNKIICDLKVIKIMKYNRKNQCVKLPIKPSPNLPNSRSIYLYPSLGLFEGTVISVGRGTDLQFQIFGHPKMKPIHSFKFTPESKPGAKSPLLQGFLCNGVNLQQDTTCLNSTNHFNLRYLIYAYKETNDTSFFLKNGFFEKLAGTDALREQLIKDKSENFIRSTWKKGLEEFAKIRKKYLIY